MDCCCAHPFAYLRSIGVPGQSWCELCKTVVMCSHPFYRLNYQNSEQPLCEACGSALPPDHDVVAKIMHAVSSQPARFVH